VAEEFTLDFIRRYVKWTIRFDFGVMDFQRHVAQIALLTQEGDSSIP